MNTLDRGKLVLKKTDQWKISDKIRLRDRGKAVRAARSVKNVSVCFETSLTMEKQVNATCNTFYHRMTDYGELFVGATSMYSMECVESLNTVTTVRICRG